MSVAVGTIVAGNYLAFARVLAESFSSYHPGVPCFTVLVDGDSGVTGDEEGRFLSLEDVGIPDIDEFRGRYDSIRAAIAAKPFLLRHLLGRGFERAVFIDADSLVRGSLSVLLDASAPITLVPHHLDPLDEADRELRVLQSGIYNGGVVGVSRSREAEDFLGWWAERVYKYCRHDRRAGLHFDQRWLDLAPCFFEGVELLRDPSINVAYWNLAEREGVEPALFHFSGFNPSEPDKVSRHEPALQTAQLGAVAELFQRYAELLIAAGWTPIGVSLLP